MVLNQLGTKLQEANQELPEGIHFPLQDSDELDALEIQLRNPDIEKQVVSIYFFPIFLIPQLSFESRLLSL